jgi:PBP1b-binding outer membrane lipoprotein LpoB
MKILNLLIPVIVFTGGCQSEQPRTASPTSTTTQTAQATAPQQNAPPAVVQQEPQPTSVQQVTTGNATYTIETIPNTRLTPTSREGDKADRVYSSNIIAVYVHTNTGVTMNSTNATVIPAAAINPQAAGK